MKSIQLLLPLMALAVHALAVPASNETFSLKQPDGTSIEVRNVGDEHFHVLETADGYILQEDELGYYAYADETGESSKIYARDAKDRSASDIQFLSKLKPKAVYRKLRESAQKNEILAEYNVPSYAPQERQFPPKNNVIGELIGEFRGIVILVQFKDVKFKSPDPQKLYTDFMNKEGFNEFSNHGSVRDYFIKNSMGKFVPTFDVYGPITLPETRAFYVKNGNNNIYTEARLAFKTAAEILSQQENIDFSKYDKNGNSAFDFPVFIFAGVGSHDSRVKEAFWPHKSLFSTNLQASIKFGNNLYLNDYVCAAEINGYAYNKDSTTSTIQGIGTVVHEIGHSLGLPDLYNTSSIRSSSIHLSSSSKPSNSSSSSVIRKTPGNWEVMDVGVYNCLDNPSQACSPPMYSAFDRMSLGWLTPTELEEVGSVKLDKIDNNVAYSITNPKNPDEFFLLEYRSHKDWDKAIPISGMLIWHIDYVDSIWLYRIVNNRYEHLYVDIVEADTAMNVRTDAFPGLKNVTSFNKFIFWNGDSMKIALYNITESPDSEYVTFTVDIDGRLSSAAALSSSSQTIESSSSEQTVFATHHPPARNVRVRARNGDIYIHAPQQGEKTVRIFSPIGALLFEKTMDGTELVVEKVRELRNANVILSVTQGNKRLFTEMIAQN